MTWSCRVRRRSGKLDVMKKATTTETPSIDTIKLGVDVHADFHVVSVQEDGSSPKRGRRIRSDEFLDFVKEQQSRCAMLVACYEAGPFGYALHRQLQEIGVANIVVCPRIWDEGGKAGKTDNLDAMALCQRLDRYHRGNRKAFDVVHVPTVDQELRRAASRQREQFQKLRKSLQSMGRCFLLTQGIRIGGRWWTAAPWQRLQSLCDARQLEHLAKYVPALEAIDASELELAQHLREKARPRERTKGMGELTDECLESEVVDWTRFGNRRQVGSYSGLCPREHSSGKKRRQGSVSKRGNVRIRTLMVEMAWRIQRYQPDYPPVAKRADVFENGNSSQRKKAIVAVARRLFVDIWRVRSGQCQWENLGLAPA